MCLRFQTASAAKLGVVLFRKTARLSSARGLYKSEGGVGPQKGGSFPRAVRCFCKNLWVFTVFGATGFGVPGKRVNPFGRQV